MNDSMKHAEFTHTQPEVVDDDEAFGSATAEERAEARIDRVLERWHQAHPPAVDFADDSLDGDDDDDPILAELRRAREELAAEFGYGTDRYREHLRRVTFLCGNDVVARSKSGKFEVVFKGTGKIRIDFDKPGLAELPAEAVGEPQHG